MTKNKTALIVGASRGLGLALAQEFLRRAWHVVGTVRDQKKTKLHDLAATSSGALEIESLDINDVAQISALKARLANRAFDLLFVNAGVANPRSETIGGVSMDDFTRIMVTNSLSVMRVVDALTENVSPTGSVGVMSSGQGSIADNERGDNDVYRASKAAPNMLMKGFAARQTQDRCFLLLAPGWIQTDMGGPDAKFTVAEAMPQIVDTILAQEGKRGLQYLDRFGKAVRW